MEIEIKCGKCTNGFIRAYAHIQGGRCFSCKGRGYFVTTKDKEARKAKRKAAKKAEIEARAAAGNIRIEALLIKYANDSRVGPKTKARCEKFDAVAQEVVTLLDKWDNTPDYADKYWWVVRNLAE